MVAQRKGSNSTWEVSQVEEASSAREQAVRKAEDDSEDGEEVGENGGDAAHAAEDVRAHEYVVHDDGTADWVVYDTGHGGQAEAAEAHGHVDPPVHERTDQVEPAWACSAPMPWAKHVSCPHGCSELSHGETVDDIAQE